MGLIRHGNILPMSVRIGFPSTTDSRDPRRATLEVRDETSGVHVLEISLTAEQFTALLGGSTAHVNAGITTRLDRVGKRMEHDSTSWPDGYATKEPEAQARAEQWQQANGWESLSLSQAHGTWTAIGRRWVAPQ